MAIKIGRKLIGENPDEQLKLEKKRFKKNKYHRKNSNWNVGLELPSSQSIFK